MHSAWAFQRVPSHLIYPLLAADFLGVRLTPRSGLAPQPVSAGSGALCVNDYSFGWRFDRDFYGVTGSKCDLDSNNHAGFILPESPLTRGSRI